MEKYITDNTVDKDTANKGYTNDDTPDEDSGESWLTEYTEKRKYRDIGFGRDEGFAR